MLIPWLPFVAVVAKVLMVTAVRSEVEELDSLERPRRKKTSGDLPTELSTLTENLSEGCQLQMSSLLKRLMQKCQEALSLTLCAKDFQVDDETGRRCEKFYVLPHCERDLIAMMVADEHGHYEAGNFLRNGYEWFKNLAATKRDGMLWAGFWPGGEPQRTSKDALMGFAELMDKDVVHPNSELGRIVADAGDLQECSRDSTASSSTFGFWTHASQAFVAQMLWKNQSPVLMLVNKDLNPNVKRSFQSSVLAYFELPNLGEMVYRSIRDTHPQSPSDPWLPQVVVVDLRGTCKELTTEIRRVLALQLGSNKDADRNVHYANFLSWLKHKPVICKKCASPCKLDQKFAMELKKDVGSAEERYQKQVRQFGIFKRMVEKKKAEELDKRREKQLKLAAKAEETKKKREAGWIRKRERSDENAKRKKEQKKLDDEKFRKKFESRNAELAKKHEEEKRINNPWFKGKEKNIEMAKKHRAA